MYDPKVGRFLSEDPIGFEAGDANKYRYVENAPTTYVDSDGLQGHRPGIRPRPKPNPSSNEPWFAWPTWNEYWAYFNPLDEHGIDIIPGGDYVQGTAITTAVVCSAAAGGVAAWGAAGLPTYGAGVITTSETTVAFQLGGTTYIGTTSGVVAMNETAAVSLGYWTSVTGVPILSESGALAAASGPLWASRYPCASRAAQAFFGGGGPLYVAPFLPPLQEP